MIETFFLIVVLLALVANCVSIWFAITTKRRELLKLAAAHDMLGVLSGAMRSDAAAMHEGLGRLESAIANIPQRGKPGRPPRDPAAAPAPKPKRVRKSRAKPATSTTLPTPQPAVDRPVEALAAPSAAVEPADTRTMPLDLA